MNQSALRLVSQAEAHVDRTGFNIGWDHAQRGLVPPAELWHAGTPVCQGWMAGKSVFGHRTLSSSRGTRLCLRLRLLAWRRGIPFDDQQVTPNFLGQIHTQRCPVLRCALGGVPGQAEEAVVERLNPQAGYAAGNLAELSAQAAAALEGLTVQQAVRLARSAETSGALEGGFSAAAWWRLATLRAFATPLPFAEAARLPLAVMPPNRVRLLNAAQGLQALVTHLFAAAGWSARCRALALLLPAHTLRHDFNLFVGAMAPRVLEAGNDPAALRQALEDAWLNDRVLRRWQHLVLSLGEAATADLLERAAQAGLATVRIVCHLPQHATEGWGLQSTPQLQLEHHALPLKSGLGATAARAALGPRQSAARANRPGRAASSATPATHG